MKDTTLMNKSVLISIKPKYCKLIADGEKTIEVRKRRPTIETPFKCYIYCIRKPKLWKVGNRVFSDACYNRLIDNMPTMLNNKVIGEFICDRIYQYSTGNVEGIDISDEDMIEGSCLSKQELGDYEFSAPQRDFCMYRVGVYGWHISQLVIYDTPKGLSEFNITKAPQSWRYVE